MSMYVCSTDVLVIKVCYIMWYVSFIATFIMPFAIILCCVFIWSHAKWWLVLLALQAGDLDWLSQYNRIAYNWL